MRPERVRPSGPVLNENYDYLQFNRRWYRVPKADLELDVISEAYPLPNGIWLWRGVGRNQRRLRPVIKQMFRELRLHLEEARRHGE